VTEEEEVFRGSVEGSPLTPSNLGRGDMRNWNFRKTSCVGWKRYLLFIINVL